MKVMLQVLLVCFIYLISSCNKNSDFGVLNFSHSEWVELDPFEAKEIIFADISSLLKKYQNAPNISFPEVKMEIFYKRQLDNYRFFMPGEDGSGHALPLTTKGKIHHITEIESRKKLHLLRTFPPCHYVENLQHNNADIC